MVRRALLTSVGILLQAVSLTGDPRPLPVDNTVTAVGSVSCFDGSRGTTTPLAGAKVVMMDSDADGSTLFDDEMGHDWVQPDGSFRVTGRGGDPSSGPDVYLRFVYNDGHGVRLTEELNNDHYFDTPQHDHNNIGGGTISFGDWITGVGVSPGQGTKCGVWLAAKAAYQDYRQVVGGDPPAGHWDVEYWSAIGAGTPWTNTDTTHWPIHYPSYGALHEFGHTIRHSLDGDGNHFSWDVTRFRYARNHEVCDPNSNRIGTDTHAMGLAFGFNEGWAEFWEGTTQGCTTTIDDESEGNNAYAINTLATLGKLGRSGLVAILRAHPGQIHSLDELIRFAGVAKNVNSLRAMQTASPADAAKRNASILAEYRRQHPILTVDEQVAAAQSQIQSLERILQEREGQLTPPKNAVPLRECGSDCEALFHALISPVFERAEAAVHRLALTRWKSWASPSARNQLLARASGGTLDAYLRTTRDTEARAASALITAAFAEAIRATAQLEKSASGKLLVADLRAKAAAHARLVDTAGRQGNDAALGAFMPEDIPKVR